jgi:hypothetical protein
MVKWNGMKLLQLRDDVIPNTLKETSGKTVAKEGAYALNIYSELSCRCGTLLGLHVLSAYCTSKIFYGKYLVEAERLKIVLLESSKIIEVGLMDEFNAEDFVLYEPPNNSNQVVAEQPKEPELKRSTRVKQRNELSQ